MISNDGLGEMDITLGIVNKTFALPGVYYITVIARDSDNINPVRKDYFVLMLQLC